jgi:hypothetical protein
MAVFDRVQRRRGHRSEWMMADGTITVDALHAAATSHLRRSAPPLTIPLSTTVDVTARRSKGSRSLGGGGQTSSPASAVTGILGRLMG